MTFIGAVLPPHPKAPVTAPPPTPKSSTSTPTLYQQAQQQAVDEYNAAAQPILGQQAASDAYYQQRQADAGAASSALAQALSALAPGVAAPYDDAAKLQGLLGKGYSDGMQAALNGEANQANDLLTKLNSPAQVDPHSQQAGDVLYGLGGYIPGDTFLKTGAAFGAAAALQPGIALKQGAEWQHAAAVSGADAHSQFDAKLADLAAKIPGDTTTNYQKLQQLALDNKKFALQVQKSKFDQAYKTAQQQLATAKYNTSVDEFNARQKLSVARLNQQAAQFAARQANSDRSYQLSLERLGISQKRLQMSIAANAYKQAHGGFTSSQVSKFQTKLEGYWVARDPKATYESWVKAAITKGIPVQLATDFANSHFPETQKPAPGDLAGLLGIGQAAASAYENFNQNVKDYKQMTGVTLGNAPDGTPITWSAPTNLSSRAKQQVSGILNLASEYLGTPYVWGGTSPKGFDCSGLATYIYAKEGIQIPRTTYEQFQRGLAVPRSQLQAGDLVFFKGSDSQVVNGQTLPGHVGIYIGGGRFVEAPHTGDVVKISSLAGYPGYMGARRFVH